MLIELTVLVCHRQNQQTSSKHAHKNAIEFYEYSCRQMAYDNGFLDIVEIIDVLDGRLFPGVKPRQRVPRYRRPLPPPASSRDTSDTDTSSSSDDESDVSGEAGRKKKDSVGEEGEDTEVGPARTTSTSGDGGDGEPEAGPKRRK